MIPDFIARRLKVERNRIGTILNEISQGSTPEVGFYALIAAASLIASLGLIANSAAVVIGAMLVSPLMTPIFGIALGMIRGDAILVGKGIRAEVGGIVLAIAFGAFLGTLPITTDVTPEMLSRTEPTLLDLLVAVFAGFAGALALINERISPALPGVAISTAIVPPLSTCGLCLAFGAYRGAYGALLLFTANFLAILLVSSLVFALAGLVADEEILPLNRIARRLLTAGLCFLIVALILTKAMVGMIEERNRVKTIRGILTEALHKEPTTSLVDVLPSRHQKELSILATVRTPKVFSPDRVKRIEETLQRSLDTPLQLIVRCVLSRDVVSTGTTSTVTTPTLDGTFLTDQVDPDVLKIQQAEQTLREVISGQPQLELQDTNLLYLSGDVVILATIQTPRLLVPLEVSQYQAAIQERLKDPAVRLLVRCILTTDITSRGRILYGNAHFGPLEANAHAVQEQTRLATKETGEFFATYVDAVWVENQWKVRAEITGPRVIRPAEIARIEQRVTERVGQPVSLCAWSRIELMVTRSAFMPVEQYTEERLRSSQPEPEQTIPPAGP